MPHQKNKKVKERHQDIFNSITLRGPLGTASTIVIPAGSLNIVGDVVTLEITSTDLATIGLGDTFDEGEVIEVIENVTATCDNQNSDFTASWGCNGADCEEALIRTRNPSL